MNLGSTSKFIPCITKFSSSFIGVVNKTEIQNERFNSFDAKDEAYNYIFVFYNLARLLGTSKKNRIIRNAKGIVEYC